MRRVLVVLTLSWASSAPGTAFSNGIVVQPGDTLWAIARRHGTTIEELRTLNGLTGDVLPIGAVLDLPGEGTASDAADLAAVAPPATWTVKPGDTLYDIALASDVTVEELMVWNRISGALIRPGQELFLGATGVSSDLSPLTVEIRPGDSLWRLSRTYGVSIDAIATANDMAVEDILRPGDLLVVPGVFAGSDRADQGGYVAPIITVDAGDSLWSIARRYGTTVEALKAANGLTSDLLKQGQSLRLVGSDARSTPSSFVSRTPEANAIATGTMVWPLTGPITSRFGWRSLSVSGSNMHYGIDIDGVTGDPIVSATDGTVAFTGWLGGFGQLVVVERGDTEYYYAHASEILVREGQAVAAGQLIARVGTTGRVTGSHLHFEVRVDGSPVDPLPLLEARAGRR